MKILFSSYAFYPRVGGIETVSALLAEEFARSGHEVELITETPGDAGSPGAYSVTRRPSLLRLRELLRWADVMFQNNISLRSLLPALVLRKPTLLVHQTWIRGPRGKPGWNGRIKRALLPAVRNVAISQAVADDLATPSIVIPNPYRDNFFRVRPEVAREKALVFLGRLVSDKGVDLLLEALAQLRAEGLALDLTIIGNGPEEPNLRAATIRLGLERQVSFAGEQSGAELVRTLNQHRVIVVPSRWAEPFGVVALEGLGCGCVAVGSEEGGLKEAIGPGGLLFANGNASALAEALRKLFSDRALEERLRHAAPEHLAGFRARKIADEYLQLLEEIAR